MELIGKTDWGRKVIKKNGKDWSIVSHDETTILLKSDKTGQEMRVSSESDKNFHKVTQELFPDVS